MALDIGGPDPVARVLAALASPCIVVDEAGLVAGWNEAAADRFAIPGADARGRPEAAVVGLATPSARLPLSPIAGGGELLVWPSGDADAASDADVILLQKADALGRLAGGISHDLVNRLGGARGLLSLLATDARLPRDAREDADDLARELDRGLLLTRGLLAVARRRPAPARAVLIGPLVRETLELTENFRLNVDSAVMVGDEFAEVDADETRLRQALLAVTLNAIEAMGGEWTTGGVQASGRLRVLGRVEGDGDAGRMRLAFEDSGPVVPERLRDGLFQAGLGAGGGRSGRDLAVAHALITGSGGRMTYEPLPDGNRIVIELPLAGSDVSPDGAVVEASLAPVDPPEPDAFDPPTVLVCDNDQSVRDFVVRFVERAGYRGVAASGGPAALAQVDAGGIDLVIADQRMPEMSGIELFGHAVERRATLRTRFILMTGDAASPDIVEFARREGVQVIEKPIDSRLFADTLRRLLGR